MTYGSRISSIPGYATIYDTLKILAKQEIERVSALGHQEGVWLKIVMDNVQHYLRQRDLRIGRENRLIMGTAATVVEAEDFHPDAYDLDDKLARVQRSERRNLTPSKLLSLLDGGHLLEVTSLQWLRTLVWTVPRLAIYKGKVSELYRGSKVKSVLIPSTRKTKVHTLATNGQNESITTELKAGVLDFLKQIGQTSEDHIRKIFLIGGDGLTYEKLLHLKRVLQMHDGPFENFEILQPYLESWHTQWTDLIRIFQTHWGDLTSKDPSSLANASNKIGRKPPPNLKKVDYYPGAHLVYLDLDARMLDCWR